MKILDMDILLTPPPPPHPRLPANWRQLDYPAAARAVAETFGCTLEEGGIALKLSWLAGSVCGVARAATNGEWGTWEQLAVGMQTRALAQAMFEMSIEETRVDGMRNALRRELDDR